MPAAVAVALLSVVNTLAQDKFRITNLGTLPGGANSAAFSINDAGEVAGDSTVIVQSGSTFSAQKHAFRFRSGAMEDLGVVPGDFISESYAINSSSTIVGTSFGVNGYKATRFNSNNTLTPLGTLPGDYNSWGRDINSSGYIVGESYSSVLRSFLYDPGTQTMSELSPLSGDTGSRAYSINNGGKVVGWSLGTRNRGYLNTGTSVVALDYTDDGYNNTYAMAINNNDQVAGRVEQNTSNSRAFVYSNGVFTRLGTFSGGDYSTVDNGDAINDLGMVVGKSNRMVGSTLKNRAFFYDGAVMHDLNDLQVGTTWEFANSAKAINIHGQIVGDGFYNSGNARAYVATPELHWQSSSSGSWATANGWSWGLAPSNPHPVYIDRAATGSLTVSGPGTSTTIAEMNIGTTGNGVAELQLQAAGQVTIAPKWGSTGKLTIGSKGILSGSGVVTGDVVVKPQGKLSPGGNAGEITIAGSVTFETSSGNNGNFSVDIDDSATPLVPAVTFDVITVTGSGHTFSPANGNLNVTPHSGVVIGKRYVIVKAVYPATIATAQSFANLIAGLTYTDSLMSYTVDYSVSEIGVTFSYVPEPTSLGGILLGALLLRRRTR
jgi:probable HAF family extracellular repeat protein